jgi:chromosome segregation ATPase
MVRFMRRLLEKIVDIPWQVRLFIVGRVFWAGRKRGLRRLSLIGLASKSEISRAKEVSQLRGAIAEVQASTHYVVKLGRSAETMLAPLERLGKTDVLSAINRRLGTLQEKINKLATATDEIEKRMADIRSKVEELDRTFESLRAEFEAGNGAAPEEKGTVSDRHAAKAG